MSHCRDAKTGANVLRIKPGISVMPLSSMTLVDSGSFILCGTAVLFPLPALPNRYAC